MYLESWLDASGSGALSLQKTPNYVSVVSTCRTDGAPIRFKLLGE